MKNEYQDKPKNGSEKKADRPKTEPLLFSSHEASESIAKNIIPRHHSHLASANILFLCRNKSTKRGGVPVPGNIKRASPVENYLTSSSFNDDEGADFIMTIALDVWNTLSSEKRIAIVDHLLTHCVATEDETNGEMKYSIRPPTVQEFPEVTARNGSWTPELVELAESLKKE